jgi:hypothetical protein
MKGRLLLPFRPYERFNQSIPYLPITYAQAAPTFGPYPYYSPAQAIYPEHSMSPMSYHPTTFHYPSNGFHQKSGFPTENYQVHPVQQHLHLKPPT